MFVCLFPYIHMHKRIKYTRTCTNTYTHANIQHVYIHVCVDEHNTYSMDACVRLPQTPSHDVAHTLDPQIKNPNSFFAFW